MKGFSFKKDPSDQDAFYNFI